MSMLLLAVFLFTAPLSGAIECPNVKNPSFDAESRDAVVNRHNELRSMLTRGEVIAKGGVPMPSGKNIYQMSWDCKLEEIAQSWTDQLAVNCGFGHSPASHRKGAGENGYKASLEILGTVAVRSVHAVDTWWVEVKKYNASANPENIYRPGMLDNAGHFFQAAWGETRYVGCGHSRCKGKSVAIVFCNYETAGNHLYHPIYELGHGCSKASDCTTFPQSTCNTTNGLCMSTAAPTVHPMLQFLGPFIAEQNKHRKKW